MSQVTLETPFGTVSIHFHSDTTCTANLWQEPKLIVNTVTVEGLLQFQRHSQTWEWQRDKSNLDRKDNGRAVSEAIRNKLTTTLTTRLNEWYGANPEAFQAVKAALLWEKLAEEEAELARLIDRTEKQKGVVRELKEALWLAQHQQPKQELPQP